MIGAMSAYVGVVFRVEDKEPIALINPDFDNQLDDPCWLQGPEPRGMLRLPRRMSPVFGAVMDKNGCYDAMQMARRILRACL